MENSISCIFIDDEITAIKILEDFAAEMPRLKVHRTYTNPVEAFSEIGGETGRQLIFMDIDMPSMTGLRLAENLKNSPHKIIFTTSHAEHAVAAFKVGAKHYLLKPFNIGDFAEVVNQVVSEHYDAQNLVRQDEHSFFLRTNGERGKLIRVLKSDIIYLQGANNHVFIYTPTDHYSIYMTINEMDEILSANENFYRVAKSYIINNSFVKEINGHSIDLGKYEVIMSPQYKQSFMDYVNRGILSSKRL